MLTRGFSRRALQILSQGNLQGPFWFVSDLGGSFFPIISPFLVFHFTLNSLSRLDIWVGRRLSVLPIQNLGKIPDP